MPTHDFPAWQRLLFSLAVFAFRLACDRGEDDRALTA